MKNLLFRLLLLFACLILFASCRSKKEISKSSETAVITIKERVEFVATPPDSAVITALFECDSTNNVLMKEFSEYKGKTLSSEYSFKKGVLNLRVKKPPDSVFITVTDTISVHTKADTVTKIECVNVLKNWQKSLIGIGMCTLLIILIIAIIYAVKIF